MDECKVVEFGYWQKMGGVTKKLFKLLGTESRDIKNSERKNVLDELSEIWTELKGSDVESTFASKIYRAEKLKWDPPVLSFILERHGGTVNGSSRADLHEWAVDLSQNTAACTTRKHRVLSPPARQWKHKTVAEQAVEIVLSGAEHEWLSWVESGKRFCLNIGKIVPDGGANQTTASRRKKFSSYFKSLIQEHGWHIVHGTRSHTYETR